jgi:hypothetical protein
MIDRPALIADIRRNLSVISLSCSLVPEDHLISLHQSLSDLAEQMPPPEVIPKPELPPFIQHRLNRAKPHVTPLTLPNWEIDPYE